MKEENKDFISGENARIKVIGVGGGGGNAVNRMIEDKFDGAEFVVVNTDHQVLQGSGATKVLIGEKTTRGLGAGANPELGKRAAEENREEIKKTLENTDLVYIAAGMGGGTGTGAAPVVAEIASELGILTIGIVTLPFTFEGRKRMRQAKKGKREFSKSVDTLITIPNDKILESLDEKEVAEISMESAFKLADSVLSKAAMGVTSLINKRGHINLDFADIRTVVKVGGSALMGIGEARGENAAVKAAQEAMTNPLLMHGMVGAKGVIMNFTSSSSLPMLQIQQAAAVVEEQADEDADIFFGHVIEQSEDWEEDKVEVTIVATGFVDDETEFANSGAGSSAEKQDLYVPSSSESVQVDEKVDQEPKKQNFNSIKKLDEELGELDIPTFLRAKGS